MRTFADQKEDLRPSRGGGRMVSSQSGKFRTGGWAVECAADRNSEMGTVTAKVEKLARVAKK